MRSKISALGAKLLPKNLYSRLTLITVATVITGYAIIYAYTNLPIQTSGNPLTATIWNDLVTKINDIGTRTDGITSSVSGNVGIGTANPNYKLDISGDVSLRSASTLRLFNANNSSQVAISNGGVGNSRLDFYTSPTPAMSIDAGNVGIGTTTPGVKLDVNGAIRSKYSGSNVQNLVNGWNQITHNLNVSCPGMQTIIGINGDVDSNAFQIIGTGVMGGLHGPTSNSFWLYTTGGSVGGGARFNWLIFCL